MPTPFPLAFGWGEMSQLVLMDIALAFVNVCFQQWQFATTLDAEIQVLGSLQGFFMYIL